MSTSTNDPNAPLAGVRVLSLALNLPGPAALMRCRQMGATCTKLEPPPPAGARSADPMGSYMPGAYAALHEDVEVVHANLKTPEGQAALHAHLAQTDVLITSFRPSASRKLGVDWASLQARHPQLSLVEIVGAPGARADEPGHDLTYLAESGLVTGLDLPPTLFVDMAGSVMASEAVLRALLRRATTGLGTHVEVALSEAANYLALPHTWGLTQPTGSVGGAHAGYRVYACADGRVAVAALETHFAASLCAAAGVDTSQGGNAMFRSATHAAVSAFFRERTCEELNALAVAQDIPLYTMPDEAAR
ncbi:CaiB/BaiF CoA-transferase family protein [Variovorax sp. J22R133]|uniref:CaiB/BaiF CoA-transferase family protein n=1 Tax=Variovorax brevis TaxID=3053503 RepID=UPI002578BF5C|nr:CaiB/BaiF CoA-transferase family protein [Variovorax sp. J22R133]MDM0112205.1 CaiB/BaiF CoA-transferase family protein [Variovorax sp. J22R133]